MYTPANQAAQSLMGETWCWSSYIVNVRDYTSTIDMVKLNYTREGQFSPYMPILRST